MGHLKFAKLVNFVFFQECQRLELENTDLIFQLRDVKLLNETFLKELEGLSDVRDKYFLLDSTAGDGDQHMDEVKNLKLQVNKSNIYRKTCFINDPHRQTHSPARSDHYSHLKVVLFCYILKSVD